MMRHPVRKRLLVLALTLLLLCGTVTASAAETGPPTLNSSRLPSVLTPVSFRLPVRARPSSVFADSGEIT